MRIYPILTKIVPLYSLAFFDSNIPFWFPIIPTAKVCHLKKPEKATFFSKPLVIYRANETSHIAHTDVCPHQGASLSKGWVNEKGHLQCPYHGFEFDNQGCFCKIPNPADKNVNEFKSRHKIKTYETKKRSDFIYINNWTPKEETGFDKLLSEVSNKTQTINEIFYPPEEYDDSFRGVSGTNMIPTNYKSVCENLLDMLHISYVHSFGSPASPLPYSIKFEKINDYHGRTKFSYKPRKNTISGIIGKVKNVSVENEYILPTNTVTRVFAGDTVKTVFTRSIPIDENRTLLYWKIYRNFWVHPLGDFLIDSLMKRTVQEDVKILKHVYSEKRKGPIQTKYDVTIKNFRKALEFYEM